MRTKIIKNIILNIIFLCPLTACYVVIIFPPLYDLHKMRDFPLILFIAGIMTVVLSGFLKRNILTPILTIIGYITGLITGVIFQHTYLDPGGGALSNIWLIWLIVYLIFIIAGVTADILKNKKTLF